MFHKRSQLQEMNWSVYIRVVIHECPEKQSLHTIQGCKARHSFSNKTLPHLSTIDAPSFFVVVAKI